MTRLSYRDISLAPSERARLLLAELDIDEKFAQVTCYFAPDISDTSLFTKLYPNGVGVVSCLEARMAQTLEEVTDFQHTVQKTTIENSAHGIPAIFHMEGLCGSYTPGATSFPSGIGRASSWNPTVEREIGKIVGRQERAVGVSHIFAPVLDISRDPRMGRQGETYGEDPSLTAAMGVAFVEGIQAEETKGLRSEAVAKHFAGSHHTEAGIHSANCNIPERLLREIYAKPFQAAISEAGLLGIMPCYNSIDGEPTSASYHLLTQLLRSEMGFNGITVSDYGALANLHTVHKTADSFAAAGLRALSAGMDVEQHAPITMNDELRGWFHSGNANIELLDRAVLRVLETKFRMGLFEAPFALTGNDLHSQYSIPNDSKVSLRSARESLVLLSNDGVLPLKSTIRKLAVIGCHADSARFFFGGYTHFSMAEGTLAVNASMAGFAKPDVEMKQIDNTIPGTNIQADDPSFENLLQLQYPGIRNLVEELNARLPNTEISFAYGYPIAGSDKSHYANAIKIAKESDVILMTLGGKYGTSSIATTGEGIDATSINLPPCQDDLIIELSSLNKPLVGVHLDGRPASSDVADKHLSALIEAWNPGEHGAESIVDVLLGKENPSGKLPVTVARNAGQVAIYYNHPNGSAWHQGESVGFSDYVDCPHTPRYVFGHGLSYTDFEYSELTISKKNLKADDALTVSVNVTNVGDRTGTEIVQLYARDCFSSISRPVQELVGFCRADVTPGQTVNVKFKFRMSQLAFPDLNMEWLVEKGDFEIMVGASSSDIHQRETVHVEESKHVDGKDRGFFAHASCKTLSDI